MGSPNPPFPAGVNDGGFREPTLAYCPDPDCYGLPYAETKARMKSILDDIQTGRFVRDWMIECKAGQPSFKAIRRNNDAHQIEQIGEKLRAMMPWIKAGALVDREKN